MLTTLSSRSNSWYRVRPFIIDDPETHEKVLQFKHPVANNKEDDGWMKPPKKKEEPKSSEKDGKTFSLEEIAKHDGKDVSIHCQTAHYIVPV